MTYRVRLAPVFSSFCALLCAASAFGRRRLDRGRSRSDPPRTRARAGRGRRVDAVVLGSASFAQTRDERAAGNFNVFYRAPQLARSYATEFWRLYGLARR
ncbi:hypothetical protein A33K_15377 [Burkholderia humptydooensis MSMB43]|uniref:Uncharacterized protein n=1 Tax=Burkholderia humptydooensis MSMB43 TaxID=441157 RepID=A0ABN0G544_9BURK|nr:hypothetical protein A33K_15377 [Burkholderia humptydooensis MSMB43]